MKLVRILVYFSVFCQTAFCASNIETNTINLIRNYYAVPGVFYSFLSQGLSEKKIQNIIIEKYSQIFSGEMLKRYCLVISNTSIRGDAYFYFFSEVQTSTNRNIIFVSNINSKNMVISCHENIKKYPDVYDPFVESGLFIQYYHVTNYTSQQYIDQISKTDLKPIVELVMSCSQIKTFYLVKIRGKWRIRDIRSKVLSSYLIIDDPGNK